MLITTVIPTILRSSLARTVQSVLDQRCDDEFEVVVVNDSGQPLPSFEWRSSKQVIVINTNRRDRCVTRNAGAAVARGRYLHFLDDDDWLLPGAFAALSNKARESGTRWLYGSSRLVDRQGNFLIELRHGLSGNVAAQVFAGEWIPLQSSLVDTELFLDIGGFRTDLPNINHAGEDIDLMRRLVLQSDIVGEKALVACISMGMEGSTTDFTNPSVSIRAGRERVLDQPHALARLRASANSHYLKGRVVRVYLTSVLWNLQHHKFWVSGGRGLEAAASIVLAGPALFSTEFWRALTRPYRNDTFARGFREAGRDVCMDSVIV